jgi:tRNA1(Val) A37 N6-methylase TrmN6
VSAKTLDKFLNGRVVIEQPAKGYRAGIDPVFLAAAVDARPGQRVLELGTGVGTAILCLTNRVSDLDAVGVEREPLLAAMARENARRNGVKLTVCEADLAQLPAGLVAESPFDHVLANPPFFDRGRGTRAGDGTREAGRGEQTPLAVWLDVAMRRVAPRGTVTLIQRAARLPDIIRAMDSRLGSLVIQPLSARTGRASDLVIVSAKKGGCADTVLKSPVILHRGARHVRDGESYGDVARAVLRDGAGLAEALKSIT